MLRVSRCECEVVNEVLHPGEVGVVVLRFAHDPQNAFRFDDCATAHGGLGRDAELMNASAFTLRVAFGNLPWSF